MENEKDKMIYPHEAYEIIGAAMEHEAQIINYLRATGFKLGILLNFNEESLFFKRYPNIMEKAKIRTNLHL